VAESVCPWWSTIKGEHNTNESTLIECLDKLHIEGAQERLLSNLSSDH
jgi:hypothetical protein